MLYNVEINIVDKTPTPTEINNVETYNAPNEEHNIAVIIVIAKMIMNNINPPLINFAAKPIVFIILLILSTITILFYFNTTYLRMTVTYQNECQSEDNVLSNTTRLPQSSSNKALL